MASVFLVRNGPRDNATSEEFEIEVAQLTQRLARFQCRFLDTQLPQFNVNTPSYDFRHVVIEIREHEELNEAFDQVGFYVVVDLDPVQSDFLFD